MKNLQKMGGIAALYAGVAYIVGMMGFLLIVGWSDDPVYQVVVLVNNQVSQHILYLIVYQGWAIFLVVLTLALYERLKADSPAMMQTATAIGIIWATVVIAIWSDRSDRAVADPWLYVWRPLWCGALHLAIQWHGRQCADGGDLARLV